MEKIGLFFGSDTGNTEDIAHRIRVKISKEQVYLIDIYDAKIEEIEASTELTEKQKEEAINILEENQEILLLKQVNEGDYND